MKNKKGFSLQEVVVTIIVVGILSIVSVPVYRGYVKRAYGTEGRALLDSIFTAEKHFYIDNDSFADETETSIGANIGVDASGNKYFRTYSVLTDGENSFTAITNGTGAAEGISLTLVYSEVGNTSPMIYESHNSGNNSSSGNNPTALAEIP